MGGCTHSFPDKNASVGVCHLENYRSDAVDKAVDKLFKLLALEKIIDPNWKITIKPNLLMKRKPEETTTTHPEIVRSIIHYLKIMGVPADHITIADSPGGLYNHAALFGIYAATGMQEVALAEGVHLNDDYTFIEKSCSSPDLCHTFPIIRPIAEADFVISVCKLKTHCMTGLSGGVKNLFGTIPGLTKPDYHWRYPEKENFCRMLVDLCETVRPGVTFCDAVDSMEGDGPSSGKKRHTGMVLASTNPYQLDRILTRVIGREEDEILTVAAAKNRGFCGNDEVKVLGDALRTYPDFVRPQTVTTDFMSKVPAPLRGLCRPIVDALFTSRPHIDRKRCVGCGKCAESCPAHTIQIVEKKAQIDRKKCIRCYCCHEMCPIHAISVKQNRLLRL